MTGHDNCGQPNAELDRPSMQVQAIHVGQANVQDYAARPVRPLLPQEVRHRGM